MAPSYLGHTQKTAKQVPASRVDYEAMCPLFREIHLGRRQGRAAPPPQKLALSCKLPLALLRHAADNRNSTFDRVASAKRKSVLVLGRVCPLSRRAIADWLVPMRSASSA